MTDIIIVVVLTVIAFFALRSVIRRKGRCSCGCGGCDACGKNGTCGDNNEKKK